MRYRFIMALALAGAVVLPGTSQAKEVVNLAYGAIGVTEDTFAELKAAHCYIEDMTCDPIFNRFENGSIIFRAQHAGEMYQVNIADGLPPVTVYVPDGFYQVGHHYYWISQNQKLRLSKYNNPFNKMLTQIAEQPNIVVPISETDFATLSQLPTVSTSLPTRLSRKIVMRVESNGELYYVPGNHSELQNLSAENILTIAHDFAAPLRKQVLRKLLAL